MTVDGVTREQATENWLVALAVGMLVDGAIVVVEYADKRIREGSGPMHAYTEAAKRMFWPIISSTATTLCAFLPMLFWPGVPGQFMGMLPVTLIMLLLSSRSGELATRIGARLPLTVGPIGVAVARPGRRGPGGVCLRGRYPGFRHAIHPPTKNRR